MAELSIMAGQHSEASIKGLVTTLSMLRKAVSINPERRHALLSEFIYDLSHPNPAYSRKERPPLLERNPVAFWIAALMLS